MSSQRGFSLVELIMVIALTGIISAVGMSLFARSDAFSALTARDRFIAMGQVAQTRALANSGTAAAVSFSVQQTAATFILTVIHNGSVLASDTLDRQSLTLSLNGSSLTDGQTETITYAHDASLSGNYLWQFTGESTQSLCLTSTGFIHPGNCQP